MKNITLAIEDDVLEGARALAAREGTTLNAMVREHLSRLVEEEKRLADSKRRLRKLIDNSTGRLGPDFKWDRDSIYEDRLFPRHKRPHLRGNGKKG
jgi:hypothetical protein